MELAENFEPDFSDSIDCHKNTTSGPEKRITPKFKENKHFNFGKLLSDEKLFTHSKSRSSMANSS